MSFLGSVVKDFSKVAGFITPGVGSVIGAGLDILGGSMANSASSDSVSEQMGFQEQMSNTSYQRAVADMRAAGLNPALAYTQGGASTPSGSSYTSQNVMHPAAAVANTLLTQQNVAADTANKKAMMGKIAADVANTGANTELAKRQANIVDVQGARAVLDYKDKRLDVEAKESVSPKVRAYMGLVGQALDAHSELQSGLKDRYIRKGE